MSARGTETVRAEIALHLAALWRYGLVLSRSRQTAEDLVQATCVRALERGHQFQPGTRLDRWLFAILRSIWLNDLRARRSREGQGPTRPRKFWLRWGASPGNEYYGGSRVERGPGATGSPARDRLPRLCRGADLCGGGDDAWDSHRDGDEPPGCARGRRLAVCGTIGEGRDEGKGRQMRQDETGPVRRRARRLSRRAFFRTARHGARSERLATDAGLRGRLDWLRRAHGPSGGL